MRRARSLLAYWENSRLIFYNFSRHIKVSGDPLTSEVLEFFSEWRTLPQARIYLADYTRRSVQSALSQLLKYGLLLVKHSPEAIRDDHLAKQWAPWLPEGSFHFCTKNVAYAPYNLSNKQLKAALPDTSPPAIFKTVKGPKKTLPPPSRLPNSEFVRVLKERRTHRRFSKKELSLEKLADLLSLVWGVTGYLEVPILGRLLQKTSPSAGARHPGEVYVMALRVKGLSPGLYHYHPGQHYLKNIRKNATSERAFSYCARQDYVRNAAALFLMTAVFNRTMWKYRHPRAYRVVLLDAGHLCQTFCLVATWLGLAPFCTAALNDKMIEEDLGIDGILESILYVSGVGVLTAG